MVGNRFWKDPGQVPAPARMGPLPVGALPFRSKGIVTQLMDPAPSTQLVQAAPVIPAMQQLQPVPVIQTTQQLQPAQAIQTTHLVQTPLEEAGQVPPEAPTVALPSGPGIPPVRYLGGEVPPPVAQQEDGAVPEPLLVVPALPPDASAEEVADHLGKLAMVSARVEEERRQALHQLDRLTLMENRELRDELAQLRARVASLEKENRKLQDGRHRPVPTIVGDLERMTSTVAVAVLPVAGFTAVYRLTSRDVDYLNIGDRDPMLSSDYLWTFMKNSILFYFLLFGTDTQMSQNTVVYICVALLKTLSWSEIKEVDRI